MANLKESPSQTAGPYVHIGLTPNFIGISGIYEQDLGENSAHKDISGEQIKIVGNVLDGTGGIICDALIESWQSDANGVYAPTPKFPGWARIPVNLETGDWQLETIKPGRVSAPCGKLMAPHISLWIVARGINVGLQTRLYFEDEHDANRECPVLQRITPTERISTLMAKKTASGEYRFDIRLQGADETVFFDI